MTPNCEEIRFLEMPDFNQTYTGPEVRPPYGVFLDTIIFWFCLAVLILAVNLFFLLKCVLIPKSSSLWKYLERRPSLFIFFTHLGAFLALITGSLAEIVPFNTFPCWVTFFIHSGSSGSSRSMIEILFCDPLDIACAK